MTWLCAAFSSVAATVKMLKLPDYGIGGAPANDPVFFNLIAGMRKWGSNLNEGDSTTHTITGSVVGVGAARRASAVRWGVARGIVVAWVITLPASAAMVAATYWIAATLGG